MRQSRNPHGGGFFLVRNFPAPKGNFEETAEEQRAGDLRVR